MLVKSVHTRVLRVDEETVNRAEENRAEGRGQRDPTQEPCDFAGQTVSSVTPVRRRLRQSLGEHSNDPLAVKAAVFDEDRPGIPSGAAATGQEQVRNVGLERLGVASAAPRFTDRRRYRLT